MLQNTATASFLDRLKTKSETVNVSISLPIDLLKWIDGVALRNDATRSAVIKALAEQAKLSQEESYAA